MDIIRHSVLSQLHLMDDSMLRMALVVAQAGQGKTTVARQYAEARGVPAAWVRCTADDASPQSFFGKILRACRELHGGFPEERIMAAMGGCPSVDMALDLGLQLLFEALPADGPPAILIFDDVHHLEHADRSKLALYNVVAGTPRYMRNLILTRSVLLYKDEPLFRREAYVCIDDETLALSHAEIAEVALEVFGRPLTREMVSRMYELTEGWVAGVVLLLVQGGDLRNTEMLRRPNASLDDFFRTVVLKDLGDDARSVLELLAHMPRIPEEFLRETFPEWVDHLERFRSRGWFTRVEQMEERWFWVFHQLFRESLMRLGQSHIARDRLHAFCSKASEYLMERELFEDVFEIIRTAGLWEVLRVLLARHAEQLLTSSRQQSLADLVARAPEEIRTGDGWALIVQAETSHTAPPAERLEKLHAAERVFLQQADVAGELAAKCHIFIFHAFVQGNYGGQRHRLRRARELFADVREAMPPFPRMMVSQVLGSACLFFRMDVQSCLAFLAEAGDMGRQISGGVMQPDIILSRASTLMTAGTITGIWEDLETLFDLFGDPYTPPMQLYMLHYVHISLLFQYGDFIAGRQAIRDFRERYKEYPVRSFMEFFFDIYMLYELLWREDYEGVLLDCATVKARMEDAGFGFCRPVVTICETLALHRLGRKEEARALAVWTLGKRKPAPAYFYSFCLPFLAEALAQDDDDPVTERVLHKALSDGKRKGVEHLIRMALARLALYCHGRGRDDEARRYAVETLQAMRRHQVPYVTCLTKQEQLTVVRLAMDDLRVRDYAQEHARTYLGLCSGNGGMGVPCLVINPLTWTLRVSSGAGHEPVEGDDSGLTRIQKIVLSSLMFSERHRVPVETLQQDLWPDETGPKVRQRFYTLVSRLRKVIEQVVRGGDGAMYLLMDGDDLVLQYCESALRRPYDDAREGERLLRLNHAWQAMDAFVRMDAGLRESFIPLRDAQESRWTNRYIPVFCDAAAKWAGLQQRSGDPEKALRTAEDYLQLDSIHDGLHRAKYDALTQLDQPSRAAAALRDYRESLGNAGFDSEEVEDIMGSFW